MICSANSPGCPPQNRARPHGNSLRASVTDKIPDNQKVARKTHLLDHLNFSSQAVLVLRKRMAQAILLRLAFELLCPGGKTLAHHSLKIRIGRMALGDLELRKRVADALDFHVAAVRNRNGA